MTRLPRDKYNNVIFGTSKGSKVNMHPKDVTKKSILRMMSRAQKEYQQHTDGIANDTRKYPFSPPKANETLHYPITELEPIKAHSPLSRKEQHEKEIRELRKQLRKGREEREKLKFKYTTKPNNAKIMFEPHYDWKEGNPKKVEFSRKDQKELDKILNSEFVKHTGPVTDDELIRMAYEAFGIEDTEIKSAPKKAAGLLNSKALKYGGGIGAIGLGTYGLMKLLSNKKDSNGEKK